MYTLATVEADGMIRAAGAYQYDRLKIVHKESVGVHTWGGDCYTQLQAAKDEWLGPDSNVVVLTLDRGTGACTDIWMADAQKETLVPRLNKWRGCYGAWPIRKLNA